MQKEDVIYRQAAIDVVEAGRLTKLIDAETAVNGLRGLPSVQSEKQHERIFQEIIVEYLTYCIYPEYKGKPYFSIKYTENGQEFIGYGTYKPEVLSEYLKEYFMPSAQLEIVRCKDCKYNVSSHKCLHPESFFLVPDDDFYCGYAERRTDETD